ncbi:MAG TPA: methylated-DNA--[protein]-cysteine S-methyltransferase [Desulfobulbus sp.]|nr:methylated-DNA--[protein]-cysteine S-methyltransferase [Desulfobulbus sp.]
MLKSTEIHTPIGPLLLVADRRGLCRIVLPGCDPGRHGRTARTSAHPLFADVARQMDAYFSGRETPFHLPLSLHGTAFQLAVWQLLARIPFGTTRSYGELARQLGGVSKARAVGAAAHANPLPLVIPCHRLIGADGRLTGFAGGLALKEKLLRHEGIVVSGSGKIKKIIEKQPDNR